MHYIGSHIAKSEDPGYCTGCGEKLKPIMASDSYSFETGEKLPASVAFYTCDISKRSIGLGPGNFDQNTAVGTGTIDNLVTSGKVRHHEELTGNMGVGMDTLNNVVTGCGISQHG